MNQYILKFINKISSLLEDHPTAWSAMRYSTILIVTTVSLTWSIMSFKQQKILDIPAGVVAFVAVGVGGKVGQKVVERYVSKDSKDAKDGDDTTDTTDTDDANVNSDDKSGSSGSSGTSGTSGNS